MPKTQKSHSAKWWLEVVGLLVVAVAFFAIGLNATLFQGSLFNFGDVSFQESYSLVPNSDQLRLADEFMRQQGAFDELRLYEYDPEMVERGQAEVNWSILEMARRKCDQFDCNQTHFATLDELELKFSDLERALMERNVEMANQEVQHINDFLRIFNELGSTQNNNGTTQTPINGGIGEVAIEQLPVTGVVDIVGPTPLSNFTKSGFSYQGVPGDYTVTNIRPPAGYELDQVIDWNTSMTTYLSAPYQQTLSNGGLITYLVQYCKQVNRLEVLKWLVDELGGISIGFTPPLTPSFSDISTTHPDYYYVEQAVNWGWIFAGGQFRPTDLMNRAELMKLYSVAYNIPTNNSAGPSFKDVSVSYWFYDYVESALAAGVIGKGNGLFEPAKNVTECYLRNLKKPVSAAGALSATSTSGNLFSDILLGSTKNNLMSQYTFEATQEAFDIKRLTIVNDIVGAFTAGANTNAIQAVTIQYPDASGATQLVSGQLVNGSTTFNLGGSGQPYFRVPKNGTADLKIYAEITSINTANFNISGKEIRLGLLEGSANSSATFEAVGASSNNTTYFNQSGAVKNSQNVPRFVVRRAKPVFKEVNQLSVTGSRNMPTSNGTIYSFDVLADGSNVSLSRLAFDVNTTGLDSAGADIYDWQLYASGVPLDVNIYGLSINGNSIATNLKGSKINNGLAKANGGSPGVDTGPYKVVVTFNQEEVIPFTSTTRYQLRASIVGATADDTLVVSLASGDDFIPVSGIGANYDNDNGFSNTAHVVALGAEGPSTSIYVITPPANSSSATIGNCVITFSNISRTSADYDCGDSAAVIGLLNVNQAPLTNVEIAGELSKITNLTYNNGITVHVGKSGANSAWFVSHRQVPAAMTAVNNAGSSLSISTNNGRAGSLAEALFNSENSFFGSYASEITHDRNIVWSDQTGGDFAKSTQPGPAILAPHAYPQIHWSVPGLNDVSDFSGTLDWTNGYLLKVANIPAYDFRK